jgi:hypothetical protein
MLRLPFAIQRLSGKWFVWRGDAFELHLDDFADGAG